MVFRLVVPWTLRDYLLDLDLYQLPCIEVLYINEETHELVSKMG